MSELANKKCVHCTVGTPCLKGEELKSLFKQLEDGWELVEDKKIHKTYRFKDFKEALAYVNAVGKVAEEEGHHPDIQFGWGKVEITLFTHKIKGLSVSDFVMAAKCDVTYISLHGGK